MAAMLVGILFLMVGGMRPRRGSGASGLARYRGPEHSGALAATIVVSFALGTVFAGGSVSAAGTSGALLRAVLAVTRITHVRVFDLLLTVLSIAGLATTVTTLATGDSCTDTTIAERLLPYVVLVIVAALAVLPAIVLGRFRARSIAALFAATEVLAFLATPLGVALVDVGAAGWIVGIVAAAVLGGLGAFFPNAVLQVGAVAVAIAVIGGGLILGDACGGRDLAAPVATTCAAVLFVLLTRVVGVFRRG